MPVVSEAQRRAMFAAKAGKSTLGIPKSVGEEFIAATPKGAKLPEKAPQEQTPWGRVLANGYRHCRAVMRRKRLEDLPQEFDFLPQQFYFLLKQAMLFSLVAFRPT